MELPCSGHSSHDLQEPSHAKIDTVPARPTRRVMLTAVLALSATALPGCGVRLEDDAPDIPFVPTRKPIPGESPLLAVLGILEGSDELYASQRAAMLREALVTAGVPTSAISAATGPTRAAEAVTAFEASVRECPAIMLRLVGQLTASHRIAAGSGAPETLWTPAATTPWTAGAVAADALVATQATRYAVDIIAARQSPGRVADDMAATRQGLDRLSIRQTTAAGDDVQPVPLGYQRPADLTGTAARDWGVNAFIRMQAAYADGLDRLAEDRDAALETVGWMVEAHRLSRSQFLQHVPELYGDGSLQR